MLCIIVFLTKLVKSAMFVSFLRLGWVLGIKCILV
jgi:hypothetical protein